MKSILLLDTSVGSINQGDDIIRISIQNNWKELFEQNYIMRMATHTPMYTPLQSAIYKDALSVFQKADHKFLCGTNALYTNMLRPMPAWNINLFNCRMAEGTVCLGAGIGINSKGINLYTKLLYNRVLSRDYVHSVRDEKTRTFLERLGFRAENTGCPTLWGMTPDFCATIPQSKGKAVVFTLTYYEKDPQNDREMVEILLRNYETLYFWPQCMKDLDYLKSISEMHRITVIAPNIPAYERILSMEDMDYVGNRLHGGIYALQHKCRTIIISIDYRAREMNASYSFPCVERSSIADQLEPRINSSWQTQINGIDFHKIDEWKRQFV